MGLNWKWAITLFWSGIIAAAITPTFAASGPTITTLSSRPDMVSGGDALVRVET